MAPKEVQVDATGGERVHAADRLAVRRAAADSRRGKCHPGWRPAPFVGYTYARLGESACEGLHDS